jgi:hypothetical protein
MAKNMTAIHKKLDRITHKLSQLDAIKDEQREIRLQTRYLAQLASASLQLVQSVAATQEDIATLCREAMVAARQSAERTAEILREIRKH